MAVVLIRPRGHLLVGHRQKGGLRCFRITTCCAAPAGSARRFPRAEKPLRVAEAIADLQGNDICVLYVSSRPLTADETARRWACRTNG